MGSLLSSGIEIVKQMPKKSKLEVIAKGKCPRCHQGDMFAYGPFQYTKFLTMHEECPNCRLRYELEPGFFYGGAMYFSYAISVALFITIFVVLNVAFGNPPLYVYVTVVVVVNLLVFPLIFRYSRILYLHIFGGVRYDPKRDS